MGKFKGEKNVASAIFIYKDEGMLNDELWNDLLKDIANHDPIHVELITQKAEFLANLTAWSNKQEFIPEGKAVGDNKFTSAMLLIHAHMNERGIAPVQTDASRVISWQELTSCIKKPVSLVWLFGCQSDVAKKHWTGIAEILLTCTTEERFRTLVSMFKDETTMRKIVFFDEMIKALRDRIPTLAYFTHDGSNWIKSFEK